MSTPKVQHYVPQFLLRNFGTGKKNRIWAYDKQSDRSFSTHTKNVAGEGRFYDFEWAGGQVSIEQWLANIERVAKKVIDQVLTADSVRTLSSEQKQSLAAFLAVQLTRTRASREEWSAFPKMLRAYFESKGETVAPGSQAEELIRDQTENESKVQTAQMVARAPAMFGAHFLGKEWTVLTTTRSCPFLIGDNPLVRQNVIGPSEMGNLGLMSPGVEIYLPLSPTRALAMLCHALTESVHRRASEIGPHELDVAGVRSLSSALISGRPVAFSPANVINFNALQIAWSERYVFSWTDDFSLASSMIAERPHLRNGPRSQVG